MDERPFDEARSEMGQVVLKRKKESSPLEANAPVKERKSTNGGALKSIKKTMKKTKRKPKQSKAQQKSAELVILDFSKRDSDNDVLRYCLGSDNYGMCLLHPDQTVILPKESSAEQVLICSCCQPFEEDRGNIVHRRILQRRKWDIGSLPLNRNPFFSKYFAMLEAEVPLKEVQHVCYIDRHHPFVLEMDPDQSLQSQNKPDLLHSVERANIDFLSESVKKITQQVERALRRRMIDSSVSVAIEESQKQFRKKQRVTFQRGVARLINANRFIKIAKRTDHMLFDDSKTDEDVNNNLRTHLGMDSFGMCLRHPNNQTCSEECTLKLATVKICLICKSERLAGGKFQQPKDLKNVVGQIQKLQNNKREWHQRTNVLYHGKDYEGIRASTLVSTIDETLEHDEVRMPTKSVSPDAWKQAILDRLKQVQAWDSKNILRNNPVYANYFRLLELGVPLEAIKQTARLDGLNTDVLDLDPNDSAENQRSQLSPEAREELDRSVIGSDTGEDLEKLVGIVDHSFDKRLVARILSNKTASTGKKKKKAAKKKKKSKISTKKRGGQCDEIESELEEKKKRKLRLKKKIKRFLKSEENAAIEGITKEMEKQQTKIDALETELAQKNAIIEALQQKSAGATGLEGKVEC